MSEIDKIKYHIKMLGEAIDNKENPITSLVISMDWDDETLDKAHDIFERYHKKLEAKEKIEWSQFEIDLRHTFGINYQTIKSIVLAFYREHRWTEVCIHYAREYECVEFHEITKSKN